MGAVAIAAIIVTVALVELSPDEVVLRWVFGALGALPVLVLITGGGSSGLRKMGSVVVFLYGSLLTGFIVASPGALLQVHEAAPLAAFIGIPILIVGGLIVWARSSSWDAEVPLRFVVTVALALLAFLALFPSGCTDSVPPECGSFFGTDLGSNDQPWLALTAAFAAGALALVATRDGGGSTQPSMNRRIVPP